MARNNRNNKRQEGVPFWLAVFVAVNDLWLSSHGTTTPNLHNQDVILTSQLKHWHRNPSNSEISKAVKHFWVLLNLNFQGAVRCAESILSLRASTADHACRIQTATQKGFTTPPKLPAPTEKKGFIKWPSKHSCAKWKEEFHG